MVDDEIVCCMCGDVGFSEKLFRCNKCHHRFQHSYCSTTNYYLYLPHQIQECDWCQSEQQRKNTTTTTTVSSSSSSNNSKKQPIIISRHNSAAGGCNSSSSSSSGDKILKHQQQQQHEMKRKSGQSSVPVPPSPRHATRRYKLLKDVMC